MAHDSNGKSFRFDVVHVKKYDYEVMINSATDANFGIHSDGSLYQYRMYRLLLGTWSILYITLQPSRVSRKTYSRFHPSPVGHFRSSRSTPKLCRDGLSRPPLSASPIFSFLSLWLHSGSSPPVAVIESPVMSCPTEPSPSPATSSSLSISRSSASLALQRPASPPNPGREFECCTNPRGVNAASALYRALSSRGAAFCPSVVSVFCRFAIGSGSASPRGRPTPDSE